MGKGARLSVVAGIGVVVAVVAGWGSGSGSGSTGTVARVVAPACRGADLKITAERHSSIGSGGTNYTTLLITDQSSQPCIVGGVPKVVGFGPGGKTIEEAERQPDLTPGSHGPPGGCGSNLAKRRTSSSPTTTGSARAAAKCP